jgi:hypothetical protein
MPGLGKWEYQTDSQECPPIREQNAWLANLEQARKRGGGQREERDLGAPKGKIRKPQRRIHRRLRIASIRFWERSFCFLDHSRNGLQIFFPNVARFHEMNKERFG